MFKCVCNTFTAPAHAPDAVPGTGRLHARAGNNNLIQNAGPDAMAMALKRGILNHVPIRATPKEMP